MQLIYQVRKAYARASRSENCESSLEAGAVRALAED